MSNPDPATPEALLDILRRAPRQVRRMSRTTIQAAVRQLLRAAGPAAGRSSGRRQYRVDDLARAAGTTTRNVRAYQERGLLPPPRRSGRVAYFDDSHLARLKMIMSLLDRGYTSAHILELLTAWERGGDLSEILGLEKLVKPWGADQPSTMPLREVRELAGDQAALDRLIADQLVEVRGTTATVHRPELLRAFAEVRGYGVPMDTVITVYERLDPLIDDISRILVNTGARHVATLLKPDELPSNEDIGELVTVLLRFRTLATDSVMSTLGHAIDHRIETLLADYLAHAAAQHKEP